MNVSSNSSEFHIKNICFKLWHPFKEISRFSPSEYRFSVSFNLNGKPAICFVHWMYVLHTIWQLSYFPGRLGSMWRLWVVVPSVLHRSQARTGLRRSGIHLQDLQAQQKQGNENYFNHLVHISFYIRRKEYSGQPDYYPRDTWQKPIVDVESTTAPLHTNLSVV